MNTGGGGALTAANPSEDPVIEVTTNSTASASDADDNSSIASVNSATDPTPEKDKILYCSQTFVARLEGQVTVFEEEPVLLLDDSHPFWWLIRLVKTGEVGFIPGEITDNENEKLARVNRVKNSKANMSDFEDHMIEGSMSTPALDSPVKGPGNGKKLVKFDSEIMEKTITEDDDATPNDNASDSESIESIEDSNNTDAQKSDSFFSKIRNSFNPRNRGITLGYDKHGDQGVHILRIFPSKSCKSNVLYKTVLVSLKLTIEDIVADFVKRFKMEGLKDDYYISIADISMARKEDMILDGKALLSDVIDNLMFTAKSQRKNSAGGTGHELLTKLGAVYQASSQAATGSTAVASTDVSSAIGSLWGMKHDLARYRILKNIRFMINRRVDFKAKVNFLFRVYIQKSNSDYSKNVTYTTVDLDNLMKVRDVFNIAMRKFGIFPNEGARHDLLLCKKEADTNKVTEIPIKRAEKLETIMNEIVKPSGLECYFLMKELDADAVKRDENIDGDNATFQEKLSKTPSSDFHHDESGGGSPATPNKTSPPESTHFRRGSSDGNLLAYSKDTFRMKDLVARASKIKMSDNYSDNGDFTPSPMSPLSPVDPNPSKLFLS